MRVLGVGQKLFVILREVSQWHSKIGITEERGKMHDDMFLVLMEGPRLCARLSEKVTLNKGSPKPSVYFRWCNQPSISSVMLDCQLSKLDCPVRSYTRKMVLVEV